MNISLKNVKKLYRIAKKYKVVLPVSEFAYMGNMIEFIAKYETDGDYCGNATDFVLCDERSTKFNIECGLCGYYAHTTNELLEWLPTGTKIYKELRGKNIINYIAEYEKTQEWHRSSFADALCLLAMKLIEAGVIK